VRWLYITSDVPTRARDGNGRIVGARSRTHMRSAGGATTRTPIPISHTSTYLTTYMCIMHTYINVHTSKYTQLYRHSCAQLYLNTWTIAHAHAHTSPHRHTRTHQRRRRAQRRQRRMDNPPSASIDINIYFYICTCISILKISIYLPVYV
jgi:hypothetical protein